ncbi:MAG: hypothetical protein COT71_03900 [Candidatus Andersenbacteria bacterium CG10_big_fil_rev_8_21_14_0_10_54_11]|uniref:DUF8128 domain-containing protein n=1 Tax=Candidatus Andersenbacteria bacterium CG10_big_fil_rev_8_21_14_0_10_54_11 TaxID=1974485 RepID=A0A2M6WYE8_9BACT|nr:MAG: hypothetical protein COT71_03900 [Candidatus Andersenbacteria bacterium CG10_big_fil_rev_8_21_14_0_10_54_11]
MRLRVQIRNWQGLFLPLWFTDNANALFGWLWLIVVILFLRTVWRAYRDFRTGEYVGTIAWSYLQITVPEDSPQTPTSMEHAFEVWDGLHKGGDLIEYFFDGYMEAWYSCEIHCTRGRARYIMVVPAAHRTFFEGVIYGQYPTAEIREVEDYTQRYSWRDLHTTLDLYGTEMILSNDDIFPIKTYRSYEDLLAEDDRFIDPHQALVEAYTNVNEDEEFWVQILVRPISGQDIQAWASKGEAEIAKLAGKEEKISVPWYLSLLTALFQLPIDALRAFLEGPLEPVKKKNGGGVDIPKVSVSDTARMDGILHKIDRGAFRVKIRILYLAPYGKLTKPNISRAIGGFKQFNTYNLNGFRPDPGTKTNDPSYILKDVRRKRRKRNILVNYQTRDFWGYTSGYMLSPEELATLYHFPTKYARTPSLERAKAGVGSAPDNVPIPR